MIPYNDLEDIRRQPVYKNKRGTYSNVIYTFDIESTSLFWYDDHWDIFDYTKDSAYYMGRPNVGLMYIWMFGIEDKVYYGRTWDQFMVVLNKISDPNITKIIYIHNLSFEFGFFPGWIMKHGYTVENMLARKAHKPITFTIPELNIQFRCSYCLTNLSLADAAKKYTTVEKAVGDLDYNVMRGYDTELTDQELHYCEYDIITLYEIIKTFRNEYGGVYKIPYTQTGEVRRAFAAFAPRSYQTKVRNLHENANVYSRLMRSFAGGLTNSNHLHTNKVYKEVGSFDIASSYPFAMLGKKYPMTKFFRLLPRHLDTHPATHYALLYTIKLVDIECRYYNAYIPSYKVLSGHNIYCSAGRVFKADYVVLMINDVDLEVIRHAYDIRQEVVQECYAASKDYLPEEFIEFVLTLYGNKTTLKGVEGQENFYQKQKQMLNAMFGACCFNIVMAGARFDAATGEWQVPNIKDSQYIEGKLQELKEGYTHLFTYSWGTYCTSYARQRLYQGLITASHKTDIDTIYYDTDSDKMLNWKDHMSLIDQLNQQADDELRAMCEARNIDFERTRPKDIKGTAHPLGHFEFEGEYQKFITLGPKRYCDVNEKGKLEITVAGVNKHYGVEALDGDIDNFRKDLEFDYDEAHKMIVTYNKEQPEVVFTDDQGHEHVYTDLFGVCLRPTTYNMTVNEDYDGLCRWIQNNRLGRYDYVPKGNDNSGSAGGRNKQGSAGLPSFAWPAKQR